MRVNVPVIISPDSMPLVQLGNRTGSIAVWLIAPRTSDTAMRQTGKILTIKKIQFRRFWRRVRTWIEFKAR